MSTITALLGDSCLSGLTGRGSTSAPGGPGSPGICRKSIKELYLMFLWEKEGEREEREKEGEREKRERKRVVGSQLSR